MAATPPAPLCRLLPTADADGPSNMAFDEVMLEGAASGTASIRFYRWSEPTLSLGYFQHESARLADPLLAGLPYVRRATGGAALVHHHELTYALAVPAGANWQRRGESWLLRMHRLLTTALGQSGVEVTAVAIGQRRKLGEVLCFLDQTPCDLLCRGHKVVGSAQRKHRGALLQHGSILLARSDYAPALPGIHELANFSLENWRALESATLAAFEQTVSQTFEPDDWTFAELARKNDLIELKYSKASWNAKR